ncbi:polyamine aminopropyltransferase [Halobacteriovorax sp. HLS]|uniref:polyamine aminopropyltransferase n=1 Tax=Halobacteriovorax sp. HLS TaxID=2234000 RepID=UPI000FD6E77C|nr:polyamine aminopropyltransferase [Halobacteriovorax sp. HLS]
MKSSLWIEEFQTQHSSYKFEVEKTLFSGQSEFQSVDVVQTKGHGKMLLNDGLIMVTERDEFSYHDMISHVPLFVHPNPKNVLVIGGGDGGTAREVIRHQGVQKCTMVEIDKMVVDACREFIPLTAKDLDHPKMNLIIGDGVKFVKETKEKFDVILVDSTDPIGPAAPLFGPEFYNDVKDCLTEDGIVVSQGESPWYDTHIQKGLIEVLDQVFGNVFLYTFSNLTYPGSLWSFTFATKKYHPVNDFDEARVEKSGLDFTYYNKGIHKAAFALPTFVRNNLKELIKND